MNMWSLVEKHLCSLFNLIISNCYIPICWKSSVIIPLFNGGNKVKNDPNAYRGISLTSCLSKIFEKVFITRLTSLQQNFPRVSQMAYQKSICSTHTYFNVKEMVRHYTEQHSTMFVVLLDSMKAFDSAWHDALLLKLYKWKTVAVNRWNVHQYAKLYYVLKQLVKMVSVRTWSASRWSVIGHTVFGIHHWWLAN